MEESFFRGLCSGPCTKRSLGRYAVSMVSFAAIHLVSSLGKADAVTLLLSFLQYLPVSFCLARSYAMGDSLLSPILVHALWNAMTFYQLFQ